MAELKYVVGDATQPQGSDSRIIVHICNDIGGWGRGFVVALSKRWKKPEEKYRNWAQGRETIPFELGQIQIVEVEPKLWVVNLIGQRDIRSHGGKPPIRYEAVRVGLEQVAKYAHKKNATVHMPRIGSGLAGGKWEEIERIVQELLVDKGIEVTVYDLAP